MNCRLAPKLLVCLTLLMALPAAAIDRAEVMDRAKAFAYHPWPCSAANLTAPCSAAYQSDYVVGDHLGLPYDWGGFVSLHRFGLDMDQGEGAGSPAGGDVLACTTGLDCSGYVSQCWDLPHKYGTWTILDVAQEIDRDQLQPGDALNYPGYHIVIYDQELADGTLLSYEANPPNVHLNWFSSWAGVAGFDAIRFDDIEPAASDLGSLSNPILIGSFPYQDTRDTSDSPSDLLEACGAVPGTDESGREYVYAITIDQPGQLSATVSDGVGVDIDLHLYEHASERDCVARHDSMLDLTLTACGTYLLVLDTWVNAAGAELQGPYTLTVDFTPTGGACQPFGDYDYLGGPGDACAYPNSAALPFCNPNLDVLTCLYSTGADPFSFCTRACASDSDCTNDFPSGCCEPISGGEQYCFPSEYCMVEEPDGGVDGGEDGGEDGGVEPTDSGPGADGYDPVDAGGDDPIDAGGDSPADAGGDEPTDAGADQATDSDAPDAGLDAGEDADADPNPQDKDQAQADGSSCPEGYELYEGACVPLGWRPEDPGGCSCHSAAHRSSPLSLLLGLLLIGLRRRAS